jgi:predicted nucleotidyltransferase
MEHQQQNTLSRLSRLTPEEKDASADYPRDHFFGSQAREQSESNSDIYINDEAAPSFRLVLILS